MPLWIVVPLLVLAWIVLLLGYELARPRLRVKWARFKRRVHLIEDCRAEWRKVSTWLTALGLALWGMASAFPGAAASAWAALPADLRAKIPHQDWLSLALLAAIFLAKFVRQQPKESGDGQQG